MHGHKLLAIPPRARRLLRPGAVRCHVVSPTQQGGSSSGAPPFAAIAKMKTATPMGLRVFLQTPHGRMPDLHLTREEIANLSAYIVSLKKP